MPLLGVVTWLRGLANKSPNGRKMFPLGAGMRLLYLFSFEFLQVVISPDANDNANRDAIVLRLGSVDKSWEADLQQT